MKRILCNSALTIAAAVCLLPAIGSASSITFTLSGTTGGTFTTGATTAGSTVTAITNDTLSTVTTVLSGTCTGGCALTTVLNYSNTGPNAGKLLITAGSSGFSGVNSGDLLGTILFSSLAIGTGNSAGNNDKVDLFSAISQITWSNTAFLQDLGLTGTVTSSTANSNNALTGNAPTGSGPFSYGIFSNTLSFTVNATTPEPSSVSMMVLSAIAGCVLFVRRRRQAARVQA